MIQIKLTLCFQGLGKKKLYHTCFLLYLRSHSLRNDHNCPAELNVYIAKQENKWFHFVIYILSHHTLRKKVELNEHFAWPPAERASDWYFPNVRLCSEGKILLYAKIFKVVVHVSCFCSWVNRKKPQQRIDGMQLFYKLWNIYLWNTIAWSIPHTTQGKVKWFCCFPWGLP